MSAATCPPPTTREQVARLIADLDANATAWRQRGLDGQAQEAEQTAARLRAITWDDAIDVETCTFCPLGACETCPSKGGTDPKKEA